MFQSILIVFFRGKRSVAVDIRSTEGRDIVLTLLKKADVLIEPYRPGTMEKWGLGPDDAFRDNPQLIYARLSGFGQSGAYAHLSGHEINFLAASGVLSVSYQGLPASRLPNMM
jgi:alpha-methylacyl-CoA racemase